MRSTMQPAAGPREIGVDWSKCTRETRAALDAICEPKYRFGVFLKDGSHHPELPRLLNPDIAQRLAGDGEHIRRGVVIGRTEAGRERIEWEDVAWGGERG